MGELKVGDPSDSTTVMFQEPTWMSWYKPGYKVTFRVLGAQSSTAPGRRASALGEVPEARRLRGAKQ